MTFTEANTVEQRIIDAVGTRAEPQSLYAANEPQAPFGNRSLGGELRPAKWQVARHTEGFVPRINGHP